MLVGKKDPFLDVDVTDLIKSKLLFYGFLKCFRAELSFDFSAWLLLKHLSPTCRGQQSVSHHSTELFHTGPQQRKHRPSAAMVLFYYFLMMTGGRFQKGQILKVMFGLDFKWSGETKNTERKKRNKPIE